MGDGNAADCLVCRKHQEQGPLVPGGPVAEDELVLVSHIAPADTLGAPPNYDLGAGRGRGGVAGPGGLAPHAPGR